MCYFLRNIPRKYFSITFRYNKWKNKMVLGLPRLSTISGLILASRIVDAPSVTQVMQRMCRFVHFPGQKEN
jgi:hypothetical protein